MSLYGKYIKEVFNRNEIEEDFGFATYEINKNYCYIIDVFVLPEFRNEKNATKLVEKVESIAKENNCNYMITTVDIKNVREENLNLIKKFNYKSLKTDKNGVYFIKEI